MNTKRNHSLQEFRNFNNSKLPSYYHWILHIVVNFLVLLYFFTFSKNMLGTLDSTYILVLIFFFFAWAIIEYFIHRYILHGDLFSKLSFKDGHTVFHHGYFNHENMELDELIDTNRILLFTKDLLAVVILSIFISYFISVFNRNLGLLCFMGSIFYMAVYEIIHGLCHLKISKNIFIINKLQEHHRIHHKISSMKNANFSIVFPFVDSIFKTREK